MIINLGIAPEINEFNDYKMKMVGIHSINRYLIKVSYFKGGMVISRYSMLDVWFDSNSIL